MATLTLRNPVPMGVVIGPFERDLVGADRVEDSVGQRRAILVHHICTGFADVPVKCDASSFQHTTGCSDQLWAGAISWDQRYAIGHWISLLSHHLEIGSESAVPAQKRGGTSSAAGQFAGWPATHWMSGCASTSGVRPSISFQV